MNDHDSTAGNDAALQFDSLAVSRQWAVHCAQLAHDRHCSDVLVLELADRSPVARHFVIATGTSAQQIRSVGSEMVADGKTQDIAVYNRAGMQNGKWIVIDFVDVVVHLFDEEYRNFMIWNCCGRRAAY